MKKQVVVALLVGSLLGAGGTSMVSALDLGSLVKVGGIGYVITQFGEQVNSFLNSVLMKEGVGTDYATKVVPILSAGRGGYIGAAQVTGPSEAVNQVQAVVQVETGFNGKLFRIKAMIPSSSMNPLDFNRVQGVGVSAVIDVSI